MSLLSPLEHFIRRLDSEAAAELTAVKTDIENKVGQMLPVLDSLKAEVQAAADDAPDLKASLTAAVAAAEKQLREIFGL